MAFTTLLAQSGEGYDPENPGDPNPCYRLNLEASPRTGGSVNNGSTQLLAGQTHYCSASPNFGYDFKHWMMGDSVVSTKKNFYFVMPAENVTLIAYFEWNDNYNPGNPGDPFLDGYTHDVNIYASPSTGGYFNKNYFSMTEGSTTKIYAYPNTNYRFVAWKQNGTIVSTSNPLEITMGNADLAYTATFTYDPANPGNPAANSFNPSTGELIIDDFNPGYLNSAIQKALGNYGYSDVQSIIVDGAINSSDFGFYYYMNNCSLIDLSRTIGYTQIPYWAFEDMTALIKIILPASVTYISNYAFYGCDFLSELVCYATEPPVVSNYAFDSSLEGLVVRVPSSAVSYYEQAAIWENFTILPLDEETGSLIVNLPEDAADGRYKNMIIELKNISSGQAYRYIITDKTSYTFNNLISNFKYNVIVKNTSGAVLGCIYDVMITEEELTVTFESLLQPQNVSVSVTTPDGEDVTNKSIVTWYDNNGKYLTQGSVIKGILENTKLRYRIDLSQDLAMQYILPTETEYSVKTTDNNITVALLPFEEITLSGFVKDRANGSAISNASVSITQTLNGKYSKSVVVTTNNNGEFNATVYKTSCKVVAAANDYLSNTITINDIENTDALNNILLKALTGVRINTLFTYTESAAEGETANTQNYYNDYANISYKVYNRTTNHEVTDFNVQYPYIVLLGNINPGEMLSVTASSRTGMFMDVTADCVVDENDYATVTFPIVELGKLQASYNYSETSDVVAILYDANGRFLTKSKYSAKSVTFSNLADGNYKLVSMMNSDILNSILNLSELNNIGLSEGRHYIQNDVTIESGLITEVLINEVFPFDESEFYYTGDNTQFTVNKQSVTVGNYVTLRAKVDFKSQFVNDISDVKLIFDLPSSCDFVDNSVMTGNAVSSYTIGEKRVEVELTNTSDLVRFCVIPMEGGSCTSSAFVQFKLNGEEMLQPIGSVSFESELMKISVPKKTSLTSVVVKGFAPSDSKIMIYDNNVLVGTTNSYANGEWSTKIELNKTNAWSYHSIYAEIILPDGQNFMTNTETLYYSSSNKELLSVTMIYEQNEILLDMVERTVSPSSYTYISGKNNFTFVAKFNDSENDIELIKNFKFVIQTTDGSKDVMDGVYNNSKMVYTASAEYNNTDRLPINVTAIFDPIYTSLYDSIADYNDSINIKIELEKIKAQFDTSTLNIIDDTDDELSFSLTPEASNVNEYFKVLALDYAQLYNTIDETYIHCINDTLDFYYKDSVSEYSYSMLFLDNINQEAYSFVYCGTSTENEERILPVIVSAVGSIIFSGIERYYNQSIIKQWRNYCDDYTEMLRNSLNNTRKALYAKCEDGNLKIDDFLLIESYLRLIGDLEVNINQYNSELTYLIDCWNSSYNYEFLRESLIGVALSAAGGNVGKIIGAKTTPILNKMFKCVKYLAPPVITGGLELLTQKLGKEINEFLEGVTSPQIEISDWNQEHFITLADEIGELMMDIKSHYTCGGDYYIEYDIEEDRYYYITPPLEPIIDPSGFVYEGVSSNRVEGVMASCYYKEFVEDMYGDIIENVVLWDAEAYAQENPLFTDENGMYRWDVPQGLWQVKFEKEGYQTTYSEWLPVPPPQLEVNIPIVQYSQPNVIFARAYQNAIEVHFDKYMMPNFLTTDNITVTVDGENVAGSIEFLDEEACYEGMNERYVSKVRFNADEPFQAEEVTLTVESSVRSYANIRMQDDFTQTFTVEVEIQKIVCPPSLQLTYNEETTIEVSVIPAVASKGKTLNIASQTPLILSVNTSSVVINEEGKAQITLKGELPGSASLSFNVEGYDINAQTSVKVEQKKIYDSNQTMTLNEGWNWVSTYLDIDGNDGLNRIQKALGGNAQQIKSQLSFSSYSDGNWYGLMESASTEEMYMIMMLEEAQMSLNGNLVDPAEHPITLQNNWTWFGYILNEDMSLEDGLANFTPNSGDYVKSQLGFNTYYNGSWYGETELSFEVGKGYMYRNTSGAAKTLVYPSNNSKGRYVGSTSVEKHWHVDVNKYPTNMSIIAVVNVDDEEMTDYEIGAFSDGECRGSARPVYVDALNRYLLFLTVHGEGNEEITFRYYDVVADEEYDYVANEMIYYSADATIGTMPEPYALNFGTTNVNDHTYCSFEVYPNPVDKNNEIHLGTICEKVEVYNSVGVKVAEYSDVNTIDGIEVPGVYIINAIGKNSVKYCRLIVK